MHPLFFFLRPSGPPCPSRSRLAWCNATEAGASVGAAPPHSQPILGGCRPCLYCMVRAALVLVPAAPPNCVTRVTSPSRSSITAGRRTGHLSSIDSQRTACHMKGDPGWHTAVLRNTCPSTVALEFEIGVYDSRPILEQWSNRWRSRRSLENGCGASRSVHDDVHLGGRATYVIFIGTHFS